MGLSNHINLLLILLQNNKPVYLYQGEKVNLLTKRLCTQNYYIQIHTFYSNEVKNQYKKYIGLNNFKSVHAVGS